MTPKGVLVVLPYTWLLELLALAGGGTKKIFFHGKGVFIGRSNC